MTWALLGGLALLACAGVGAFFIFKKKPSATQDVEAKTDPTSDAENPEENK